VDEDLREMLVQVLLGLSFVGWFIVAIATFPIIIVMIFGGVMAALPVYVGWKIWKGVDK